MAVIAIIAQGAMGAGIGRRLTQRGATVLTSLLTGRPARGDVAMTGEITLRGKVLRIGGVKEKVLAAKRAGIATVIVPWGNEPDVRELEPAMVEGMTFVFAQTVEEVIANALQPAK